MSSDQAGQPAKPPPLRKPPSPAPAAKQEADAANATASLAKPHPLAIEELIAPPPPPPAPPMPAPAAQAAPVPAPAAPARGYEPDQQKRWTIYQLGTALILAAVFGMIPAFLNVTEQWQLINSPGIARWALMLIFVGLVQIAYAVYLIQIPDWSTAWVVSLLTLALATLYAMLLGLILLGREESQVIQFLELVQQIHGKRAPGWCVIMLSLSCLLAYCSGRISVRWYDAYQLLTSAVSGSARPST
jgi:hypothetical protein